MSQQPALHPLQQQLGRRLAEQSYFRITEQTADSLRCDSLPTANRAFGVRIGLGGVLLLSIAAAVIIGGVFATAGNAAFSNVATAALIGGVFGGIGIQRLVGGIAVATTRNSLEIRDRTLTITQSSRIGKLRSQSIPVDAVRAVQLRRRSLLLGSVLRRRSEVVALEMSVGEFTWILDGDRDPAVLQPLAVALLDVLQLPPRSESAATAHS
jgi:hypothetical protein